MDDLRLQLTALRAPHFSCLFSLPACVALVNDAAWKNGARRNTEVCLQAPLSSGIVSNLALYNVRLLVCACLHPPLGENMKTTTLQAKVWKKPCSSSRTLKKGKVARAWD